MCGLNGIYAYHAAANAPTDAELTRTRGFMAARGPDGAGTWWSADRRIGFGHRRLSILDLSPKADQPMISEDGRFILVFNGEIYNSPELRSELERLGISFITKSDTEVILNLYRIIGKKIVERLRGMFAIGIWDTIKGELFIARDPYGIKPLYYSDDGWTFRFASQVKALIAGGGIGRESEPAGLVGFHLWGHIPDPFTLYREIRALPAGHTMIVDRWGARQPERYFSIAEVLASAKTARLSPSDRADLIKEQVAQSVRAHLLADVEVGVFLSAGVDSGAVLGLAGDAGLSKPRAITLGFSEFQGTSDDERHMSEKIAKYYGAEHIVRTVGKDEFIRDIPRILADMDQPTIDGINSWFVAKAAREIGLKVALSGLGGDELLAGYPSFTDVPRWWRRYRWLAGVPGAGFVTRLLLRTLFPTLVASRPKVAYVFDYAASWEGSYLLRRGLFMPPELCHWLDPEIMRVGLNRLRPLDRLRNTLTPDPGSDGARVCALESTHYMRDQLLRDADWAGMSHGLEIRTPLVDALLLRDVAPAIHGLHPGDGKRALAGSPRRSLPAFVTERAKTGFSVPIGAWLEAIDDRHDSVSVSTNGQTSRSWARSVLTSQLTGEPEPHAPKQAAA